MTTNTDQQIILFVNGVPNASQNMLNLIAGTGIQIAPQVGGGVIVTAIGGIAPGTLMTFEGVPSGDIPGNTFTTLFAPVQASVIVNGLTLIPGVGYTLSGSTITLTTPLVVGDTIYVTGLHSS